MGGQSAIEELFRTSISADYRLVVSVRQFDRPWDSLPWSCAEDRGEGGENEILTGLSPCKALAARKERDKVRGRRRTRTKGFIRVVDQSKKQNLCYCMFCMYCLRAAPNQGCGHGDRVSDTVSDNNKYSKAVSEREYNLLENPAR